MAISLGDLATSFGCDLNGDPDVVVERVATLVNAGPGTLSFFSNSRFKQQLAETRAAVVIVRAEDVSLSPVATLVSDDPYAMYARMAAMLHPLPEVEPGVHASAVVDPSANVAASAQIGSHVSIGVNCSIGERVVIGAGSVIGPDCVIGDDSRLVANVSLAQRVTLGERCILHPGTVIGSDGFGNAMTPDGWLKVPQIGGVRIGNDVEIGSNSTVDCGAIDDTVIDDGVRIDNLCQVGHNCQIGLHTAIASGCAIGGSTVIGERCMLAGKVGTAGHLTIGDDITVLGRGTVSKSISEPGVYGSGFSVEDARVWNKRVVRFRKLESLFDRVSKLEKDDT